MFEYDISMCEYDAVCVYDICVCLMLCVCVCACVRACMCACVRACVRV